MKRLLAILLALAGLSATLRAQDEAFYRLELGGGIGLNYGMNDVNTRFYGNSGVAAGLLARFPLNARMAVKVGLNYGKMSGSAADVDDFYPADPGQAGTEQLQYRLKGNLFDLSGLYELHFLPYGWFKGYKGYRRVVPYIEAGFGLSYGTAGKAVTANFPVGVGLKWKIGERLNLGLDWTFHFTTSDKLDGLQAPHGIKSSLFRNKDHYNLTMLTLTYDLSPRCPTCNKD